VNRKDIADIGVAIIHLVHQTAPRVWTDYEVPFGVVQ